MQRRHFGSPLPIDYRTLRVRNDRHLIAAHHQRC
jgi:hypothetical protein